MIIVLTLLHVLVCLFLIIVVLLQSGKAADLAGAFGGMGSQTAFGPRGAATVLSKATTVAAALFMVTSLSLSIFGTRQSSQGTTVLEKHAPPKQEQKKGDQKLPPGPSVTIHPEGADPSTGVTIPIDPSKIQKGLPKEIEDQMKKGAAQPPAKSEPAPPAKGETPKK
jgi:preprotein translocase subunit SecG